MSSRLSFPQPNSEMPENDSLPCFECNPYDINCINLDSWGDVKVLDLKNSVCRACKF